MAPIELAEGQPPLMTARDACYETGAVLPSRNRKRLQDASPTGILRDRVFGDHNLVHDDGPQYIETSTRQAQ
jgi:hypothetical protein